MEGRDGFRRRAAIVFTDKCKTSPEIIENDNNIAKDSFIKFKKVNESNHAILNSRKKEQNFQKTIEELEHRKCTFYRMGFKSYEKEGKKKLFGSVFGLNPKQMKGTMYVGQLWSNHQVGKYMRENKIYMTKLKLMDKLQTIKKQYEEAEKVESQMGGSCRSIASLHHIGHCPDRSSTNSTSKGISFNQEIKQISGQLKKLKKQTGMGTLISDVKYLEKCKQNMDKVERKYFLRMIDID